MANDHDDDLDFRIREIVGAFPPGTLDCVMYRAAVDALPECEEPGSRANRMLLDIVQSKIDDVDPHLG